MKSNGRCVFGLIVGLISLTPAVPAIALDFDISSVSVSTFVPNPIQIGASPTRFGYSFRWDKPGGAATINLNVSATLSPNAIYGDVDDISIGNIVTSEFFSGTFGNRTITHLNPDGSPLSWLQIPGSTSAGLYHAFVAIAPVGPIYVDPDSNDAFGTRAWKVKVTSTPTVVGDFNGDGAVGAADYVVWRKNSGSLSEFNAWRANFGNTSGSGSFTEASVPEPITASTATVALFMRRFWLDAPRDALAGRPTRYPLIKVSAFHRQLFRILGGGRL